MTNTKHQQEVKKLQQQRKRMLNSLWKTSPYDDRTFNGMLGFRITTSKGDFITDCEFLDLAQHLVDLHNAKIRANRPGRPF